MTDLLFIILNSQSYLNSLLTLQAQQALVLRKLIWSESEGVGVQGLGWGGGGFCDRLLHSTYSKHISSLFTNTWLPKHGTIFFGEIFWM